MSQPPPSPFLTTSDLIHRLNRAMSDSPPADPQQQEQQQRQRHDSSSLQQQQEQQQGQPHFELQRRLPDGSTRRATAQEQKAADLESKLQQVAVHIMKLPMQDQWTWLQSQKTYGNQLYSSHEYEAAIDVYLTCIMVAQNLQQQQQQSITTTTTVTDEDPTVPKQTVNTTSITVTVTDEDHTLLFLQLMNNLAQTALQLSWNHKAIQFSNLALQQLQKNNSNKNKNNNNTMIIRHQYSKLYYKRAKAHRLRGEYQQAKQDLDQAESYYQQQQQDDVSSSSSSLLSFSVVELTRERQRIQRAQRQSHKHKQQQQRAMKQWLSGTSNTNNNNNDHDEKHKQTNPTTTSSSSQTLQHSQLRAARGTMGTTTDNNYNNKIDTKSWFLYDDDNNNKNNNLSMERAYSSLRAHPPRRQQQHEHDDDNDDDSVSLLHWNLYWRYYVAMVGRIAEELLVWMGDDEKFVKRQRQKRCGSKEE